MTTTIDNAGRMVIPAELREKLGFKPGTEIEITADEDGLLIRRAVLGPELVRRGKLLFSRPRVPKDQLPTVDIDELIRRERDRWPL